MHATKEWGLCSVLIQATSPGICLHIQNASAVCLCNEGIASNISMKYAGTVVGGFACMHDRKGMMVSRIVKILVKFSDDYSSAYLAISSPNWALSPIAQHPNRHGRMVA